MGIQVTIIGLDQVGQSIGLALKDSKNPITCTGFDLDSPNMKAAEKSGAVDKCVPNLHSAVEKADLILLNLTGGEVLDYAGQIAESMKDGATLINMSSMHSAVCDWAKDNLPAGRSLINAAPVITGSMLEEKSPSPELFKGSIFLISSPPAASSSAIQLVVDLTNLLGAGPLFSDPLEADGLLSMTDLFPRVVSHLLLQTSTRQSGWLEAGKIAGNAYLNTTEPAGKFIAGKFGAREMLLQNEHILRHLRTLRDEIDILEEAIRNSDEKLLTESIQHSMDARENWKSKRLSGDWEKTDPPAGQVPVSGWKKLFGMEKPGKKG